MIFRSEVVYSLRTIKVNILFLCCIQKFSFAECRSKTANSLSVKVKFSKHDILCLPQHKDKLLRISINCLFVCIEA